MLGVFGLLLLHIIYNRYSRWRAELFFVYTRFNIRMTPVGSMRGEKIGGAPLVFRSYASRFSVMRSWDLLVLRVKKRQNAVVLPLGLFVYYKDNAFWGEMQVIC